MYAMLETLELLTTWHNYSALSVT